ncbi:hypothetical protein PCANC_13537 [Puccinia coronata f. sp. avenae]|uniref:Integrase catalytic domain-containing protein n=1 Tax=Puccinia coronata f. sp. avenae TaxID=200324 RepID=A0A2N5USM7_9BASI|nr:hypothetical protein PCANC_13537 [Puccinia coronata f. sp. avenae]
MDHAFPVVCRAAPLSQYDVILGRDWIAANVSSTDWTSNEWVMKTPDGKTFSFFPKSSDCSPSFIHTLRTFAADPELIPLSRKAFRREMKKSHTEVFVCSILEGSLNVLGPREAPQASFPTMFSSSEPFGSRLRSLVSKYDDLFTPIDSVSHKERVIEHLIDTADAKPVYQNVRQMSPLLLQELKIRLHKLQSTGFIRPSTSAWSSPILFAKNASGSLRFCVDYRALNSVTKKDRHPLPLIQECFDALQGAKFFSKIDLQQGFHQMKISSADVPKTAFGTKYGHYEWLVMPFGLVNAPSTFQRMMTHILLLSLLQAEELRCSGHKCSFGLEEIQYVGHLVSQNGIRPMPEKLEAVESWPRPSNVHDVRSFLGLCGFYRRYVKNFAKIAAPLHDLTGGNVTKRQVIQWFPLHEKAFLELKRALVTAPVLLMPDSMKPYTIETDASDFAIGAVLLQLGLDNLPHPVAFESSKLNSAQRNYPAQERELLAIIHAWHLFVIQPVSDDLHPSDWPLLIPYIIDKADIPTTISPSLILTAKENCQFFHYDADDEIFCTLCTILLVIVVGMQRWLSFVAEDGGLTGPLTLKTISVPLPAVGPFERWSADFIMAIPMKEATASAIADALLQHVIIPFGTPHEFLTDRGSNFLSKGLLKFLANSNIDKINTSGYHPQSNGKNERYNGILEAAIFRLNTTGDPSKWESVLPVALYSTRIHASDSSGFSPFELTYGVSPPLALDCVKAIAADPVCPGEDELRARIKQINETRCKSLLKVSARSAKNKKSFDDKLGPDVITYDVGQSVKLRNKKYTKGHPRWFGPFEVSKKLDNNVYILVSPDGEEYSRPVNGNNLRQVSLRSLITNDMWATPPAIAQNIRQKDARVAREALAKTKAIAKLTVPPRRLRVKFDGKFINGGTGSAPQT